MKFGVPTRKRAVGQRSIPGVIAWALFAAQASMGQEAADSRQDSRPPPGLLHLNVSEMELELEGSYERRRVGSDDRQAPSHKNRDLRFEESVRLRLNGDVIDPLFLSWEANLSLGFSRERFYEKIGSFSRTESESGLLREFDIGLQFLPSQPFSVSAYTRRVRDRIPRRFLTSLLEERTEAGVGAFLTLGGWDMNFGFEWSDLDRTGNRADVDDEQLETSRFYVDSRLNIAPDHKLSFSYDHQREQSLYGGSPFEFDTRRDELRINHELTFGPDSHHRLDTFVRFNNEQGDLARDEYEFTPQLTLWHSEALRTIYRYSFYRVEQDAIETTQHRADWQTIYQPTDHLRLTTDLFWLREAMEEDLETYEFGGDVDVSHRLPTAGGELLTNVAYTSERIRSVGSAGERIVRGEAHELDPSRPTYLNELDIKLATIVVYNVVRTRIYVPGVDYIISRIGRRIVVYRLLSGRTEEGEPVLFDYRYRLPTGGRIDSHRVDLRLEHPFDNGLTPYYGFEIRRQNAGGSRGRPIYEDNTERHRFGLRYHQSRWSADGEVELVNDSTEPYDGYHLNGRLALLRGPGQTLDGTARTSWYDFKSDFDRRRVWWTDVGFDAHIRHNEYLSSTLSALYRWEDDSRDGVTNAVDIEYGLQLRRGLLEVDLTVEYDLLELNENDEGFGMWLTVRRDLSHLLSGFKRRNR